MPGARGRRSAPGPSRVGATAVVEVIDAEGRVVARQEADGVNHAWVEGLAPAMTYRYRVVVDGQAWGEGERYDWTPDGLVPASRAPDHRLRTHASADRPDPVTFLAVGDTGVGIAAGEDGRRQLGVARTMQRLAGAFDIRFVVTLGDTIYHGPGGPTDHSGGHDDDWWLTYFQPYRYLLDHLAFYPTAGNHDGADEEAADDRGQLEDNLYLAERFGPAPRRDGRRSGPASSTGSSSGACSSSCASTPPGDGSRAPTGSTNPATAAWLEHTFASLSTDVGWRVPFCHHPAWSAGPHHIGQPEQVARLVPLYEQGGARLLLHGHEHNFQHGRVGALDYIVSGAGGKLDTRPPHAEAIAGTRSWSATPHCLLVHAAPDAVTIVPYGPTPPGGQPVPLVRARPDGTRADAPIVIRPDPDRP